MSSSSTILCRSFRIPGHEHRPLRGDVHYRAGLERGPAAVICHGFKGFKDWGFFPLLAERLAAAGYIAVTFNFSGAGVGEDMETFDEIDAFERATLSGDLYDLRAILDALLAGGLPGPEPAARVALLGHSRGGGVATIDAAEDDRVACLVTWASVATFERFSAEEIDAWRRRGYAEFENSRTGQVFHLRTDFLDDFERHRRRFDPRRRLGELERPCLIVHGAGDATVELDEAQRLAAGGRPELTRLEVVPETGHTFGAVHPFAGSNPALEKAIAATLDFLRAHLPPAAAP